MTKPRLGWVRDTLDQRDHVFAAVPPASLPKQVDLRPVSPPIYDQGQLGSCTANAIGRLLEFELMKQGGRPFIPSRLFIYYCERVLEHTVASDAGAMIRDGIKCVKKLGAPHEDIWPYDPQRFAVKPPADVYAAATKFEALAYAAVPQTLTAMKSALAAMKPFVLGFSVYESFMSDEVASTGIAKLPNRNEQLEGGHAITVVGYDDTTQRFLVANSWGEGWGMKGYFTIPYPYFTNRQYASDLWALTGVTMGT